MIRDLKLILSNAQAVTTDADSSILDLNAAGDAYESLWLKISVPVTVTADGAATVTFALITDSDSGFATAPVTLYTSAAIGKASLAQGDVPVKLRLPAGVKRYLKVTYTIGTGPLTAGKFDAFLARDVDVA